MEGTDREALEKSLKAADAAVSKLFKEVGSTQPAEGSAASDLQKMATEYATEKKVDYATAFAEVTKSGKGKELLIKSRSE